mmetsp:Transcript_20682/g.44925  ORF Transcript_20682/g.44925 Transcript_20682/m.44925 type:complete len:304 (+) Transcript_20682:32-943(+)
MAMASSLFIPGLVRGVYSAGSRHSAPVPTLVRSDVEESISDFEWEAHGSQTYKITAKGSIVMKVESDTVAFDFTTFRVNCTCPDGDRQSLLSLQTKRLYVCKHAKAALDSVIDPSAEKAQHTRRQEQMEQAGIVRARRAAEEKRIEEEQERDFPGERKRIEYGLEKLSGEEVVRILKNQAKTVEGLKALVQVFKADVMPSRKEEQCGRCNKKYDPQIPADRICQIEHPYDKVNTEWDTSKKSWSHCRQCDKTFGLDGYHSCGKRGRDDPEEEGDYCYEGQHVPAAEFDPEKDGGVFDEDDCDY